MATRSHTTFTPRFEGRTRDAIVTSMIGNVVGVKMARRKRRPPLQSTSVLCSKRRAH